MRLLFFPSDLGGGFGHISRCLAIAQEAKRRGHDSGFAISDTKYMKRLERVDNIFTAKSRPTLGTLLSFIKNKISHSARNNRPLFTEISSLDYQVVRDGLVTRQLVQNKLSQYTNIVKAFKPDILVGDTNLLVWMLSKKTCLPAVQIVRYASHPATAKLIWWKSEPPGITPPNSSRLFNPLLKEMGLLPIKKAEELLNGDLFVIPSVPEIEPVPSDSNTVHVGELTQPTFTEQNAAWLQGIDASQPLLYVTIGGGAGSVGNLAFFSTVIQAFADKPIQVVVSTSSIFDPADLPTPPGNVRFFQWVPGRLLISRADLVIFHGGYGTMMETIFSGKPTITIPFHTEQEGNGRRLEELGCGTVLMMSKEEYRRIEAKWKYGTYSFLTQTRYDLTSKSLFETVDRMLSNPKLNDKLATIQNKVKQHGGAQQALDVIEAKWE